MTIRCTTRDFTIKLQLKDLVVVILLTLTSHSSVCSFLQLQGAIMVSALFQILIGMTGVIGLLLRYIGPLVITPTIALVGLSLFSVAGGTASNQWGIAFL